MSEKEEELSRAIENLSRKKHVLSEEAVRAKQEYDLVKEEMEAKYSQNMALSKRLSVLEEFNDSVKLLSTIFEASKFDELALFMSNPTRLLILNLFIGIVRGIGFFVGLILVSLLLL